MDIREKLAELIESARYWGSNTSEEIADKLLDSGVTMLEWISVDDGLPEDWADVLALSRYGFLETAVYTGVSGKWRTAWNGDTLEMDSITHWMPLPQPPKGE